MTREEFLISLMPYIGIPYVWGGQDPDYGLDCSGFVQLALEPLGIDPAGDQTAQGLYDHFVKPENGVISRPDPGCLAFFGYKNLITHVAICLNHELMIEAAGGNSRTTTPAKAAKIGARIKVSRIDHRRDLSAIIKPTNLRFT